MTTKHTPEPWCVIDDQSSPHGTAIEQSYPEHPEPTLVADLNAVGCGVDDDIARANAARIVACVNACAGINPEAIPDLLDACQMVLDAGDDDGGMEDIDWGTLRAAIAKAKGGA